MAEDRYKLIKDGVFINRIVVDPAKFPDWTLVPDDGKGNPGDTWDGAVFAAQPPDTAKIEEEAKAAIQELLDSVARSWGYDSIISLCSYAGSKNKVWAAEAAAGIAFRDDCWSEGAAIQAEAHATGVIPTVAEVLARMPTLKRPG